MSSEELIAHYVRLALEAREHGQPVDFEELCAEHPELVPAVQESLDIEDSLFAEPLADPLLGTVLDRRYAIEECIGAGAMSIVYRATDRSLGREVAVKVLQHGVLSSDRRRERFVREAKVLASLQHPHIIAIHDNGRAEQGFDYIVIDLLRGFPLSAVLQQAELEAEPSHAYPSGDWMRTRFDIDVLALDYVPQTIAWCTQLAAALGASHRAGITHRDVKPSNVFINRAGDAVLLDFGIAAREGDGSLTAAGTTIGSPWYMAPEQAGNADRATELVDIYGLCATLYHLVTFRPPYDGDYASVLAQLKQQDPVPPGRLRRELSRDLCAVIEKGMERDPARRYASVAELEADLRALRAQMPVVARPITPLARFGRRVRRRPGPWIATAGVIAAALVAVQATSAFNEAAAETVRQNDARYAHLLGTMPPSAGFEGSLEIRPLLDPEERAGHIAQLDELLEVRADDVYARLQRAALHQDQGDHEASRADIEQLSTIDGSPYLAELIARYNRPQPERGGGVLVLDLDGMPQPKTKLDRFTAAFHFARLRNSRAAEELLRDLTDYVPARYLRLTILLGLGHALYQTEQDPKLLRLARAEALELEREFGFDTARTSYIAGSVLMRLADYESALPPLRRAVELAPQSYGPNFQLGAALRRVGQLDAAKAHLERAHALRPHNMNAPLVLAQILASQGDYEAAHAMASEIPIEGFLVKPWHRDYIRGHIELRRIDELVADGDHIGAAAAAKLAIKHYEASLARIASNSKERRRPRRELRLAHAAQTGPEGYVLAALAQLREDPKSPRLLRALAVSLREASPTQAIRDAITPYFQQLADIERR